MSVASIRAATTADFAGYRRLMQILMGGIPVATGAQGQARFAEMIDLPGTTIFLAEVKQDVIAAVTLHLMPNLTHQGRPYALIENVVTDPAYRGQGVGRRIMGVATDHAWAAVAYKIMLLTGQDRDASGFYAALGFSARDKQAMTLRRVPKRHPP
jgi:GNAT superfamily N-acetyltransferase